MATTRKTPIRYRRGKPIPVLRHGDVLDWTTFPLGSKPNGRPIARCPKCGRKGESHHYKYSAVAGGATHYTHVSRFETIFWMVRESCDVPDMNSAQELAAIEAESPAQGHEVIAEWTRPEGATA